MNHPGLSSLKKENYFIVPIDGGGGAGFDVVQALRPSEATANAAMAANLTNFMEKFPLLSALVAWAAIYA